MSDAFLNTLFDIPMILVNPEAKAFFKCSVLCTETRRLDTRCDRQKHYQCFNCRGQILLKKPKSTNHINY